jgi:GAF domain-containing protein
MNAPFKPSASSPNEAYRQAVVDRLPLDRVALDGRLATIVEDAAKALGGSSATLTIVDGERERLVVRKGIGIRETLRDGSFCDHVILDPESPLIVPDASGDGRFVGTRLVTDAGVAKFFMGVPLLVEGEAVGALCVLDDHAHERPSPAAIDRLQAMAAAASDRLDAYLR